MSMFDGLREALTPHRQKLEASAHVHFAGVNHRLQKIEQAVFDLGRGDIGNRWQRFQVKRNFTGAETIELAQVPVNEMWLIQAISSDGIQEKSPAFVIESGGVLIESVIKEGIGFEGIGGDQVFMPGEEITVTTRGAGKVNCTITIIRRQLPSPTIVEDRGPSAERYSERNVHEVGRDVIMSPNGIWGEVPPEVSPTEGRLETHDRGVRVRS